MSRPYKLPPEIAGRTDLTGTDKVVYAVITYHIGKNRNGYPAIRTIAKESGASPSTVDESVQRLENNNLLRVERPGQRKVRRYSVPEIGTDQTSEAVPEIGTGCTGNQYRSVPKIGNEYIIINNNNTFDQFWESYPRKVGKKKCRDWWAKHNPDQELFGRIMKSLGWQCKQWDNPQFIPHPITWLNNERWDDEPGPAKAKDKDQAWFESDAP